MSWREMIAGNLPQSTWLEVHGCSIHAHRWYHGQGVTLVFIHGAIANNVWWQHIAAQVKQGQVLSIDLSGHGLSAWDEPYNLSKHASEVEAYIQQYAKGEVVIVGHSYGGARCAGVGQPCAAPSAEGIACVGRGRYTGRGSVSITSPTTHRTTRSRT